MPSATQLYNTGRWLNAADLQPLGQRRTAIVHLVEEAQVGMGNDQKTQLNLTLTSRQGQPWPKTLLLNKTNTLQMVAAYGDDYSFWTGKMIDIWSENVTFQGRLVAGIKVTASSNGNGKAVGTPQTQAPATPPAPSSSATAVTGLPPNTGPSWNAPRNQGTAIEDDEIPF